MHKIIPLFATIIFLCTYFLSFKESDNFINVKYKYELEFAKDVFNQMNLDSDEELVKRVDNIISNLSSSRHISEFTTIIKDLGKVYPIEKEKIIGSYYTSLALLYEINVLEFSKRTECEDIIENLNKIYEINIEREKQEIDYYILRRNSKNLGFKIGDYKVWLHEKREQIVDHCGNDERIEIVSPPINCDVDYKKRRKIYLKKIDRLLRETFKEYEKYENTKKKKKSKKKRERELNRLKEKVERIQSMSQKISDKNDFWKIDNVFVGLGRAIFIGMIEEMKLKSNSTQEDCTKQHRAWFEAMKLWRKNECEHEYINLYAIYNYDKEGITLGWIEERHSKTMACSKTIYSECTDTLAVNFDKDAKNYEDINKDVIIPDNNSMCEYRGCMCETADNYQPKAIYPDTCIFTRCKDQCYYIGNKYLMNSSSYEESNYSYGVKIIHSDSLCKTSRYICGCTNKCSSNYSEFTIINDGSCEGDVCGCLDSTAVNFAGDSLSIYYNPNITVNDTSQCSWVGIVDYCLDKEEYYDPLFRHQYAIYSDPKIDTICGCLDTLARNYSIKATHHLQSKCRYYSLSEINESIASINIEVTNYPKNAKDLTESLELSLDTMKNSSLIDSLVKFNDYGNGLEVDFDFDPTLFRNNKKSSSRIRVNQDGIPLGVYNYKQVNQIVRTILSFLITKSPETIDDKLKFSNSKMTGRIIGQADGAPISKRGIKYINKGRNLSVYYSTHENEKDTGLSDEDINFLDTLPQSRIYLNEGDYIYKNESLALLRAFFVQQQIGKFHDLADDLELLAISNRERGDKYRSISVKLFFHNYFVEIKKRIEDIEEEKDKLGTMKKILENGGVLKSNMDQCLCNK